jgi:ATP dependent DNA ligase C terminal region
MVGFVNFILTNRGNMVAATLRRTFVKIHSAIKTPIPLLYWDSPEEENRQLEKLHLTLKVSRKERMAGRFDGMPAMSVRVNSFQATGNKVRSLWRGRAAGEYVMVAARAGCATELWSGVLAEAGGTVTGRSAARYGRSQRMRLKECYWLKPELVAQIEFTEWTPDGHLRHSKFVGIREDKEAGGVVREPDS